MKGRCACEVGAVDSVVLPEIILEGVLEDLDKCELTAVQASDIVDCIRRLGEPLKDAQSVSKVVGYHELFEVLEESIVAIRRYMVYVGSLYVE